MNAQEKERRYRTARTQIESLLEDLTDPVAAMASAAAVLMESISAASWVGFYRVVTPERLRVGPYQGPVGCLEIEFSQGVCGAAATSMETQVVADVHAFPGHIACDPESRSEIVVPVLDSRGSLRAVLDVDSHSAGAFDAVDARHLERIAQSVGAVFTPTRPD